MSSRVRFFDTVSQRDCIDNDSSQGEHIGRQLNRSCRCFQSLFVSRSEKIGERAPIQCANNQRVQGAQTRRLLKALDSALGQIAYDGDPTSAVPSSREVCVQGDGLFDQQRSSVIFASEI